MKVFPLLEGREEPYMDHNHRYEPESGVILEHVEI